ncbi:MAG: hypothetical protein M3Q99_17075 [Acidobacteriota bacterium]|nr:hypothetical protein [Acidobacteriota bacterium]
MKNKLFLIMTVSMLGISFTGCTASFSTNGSNTAKPVNTASSPAAGKNANTASTAKTENPQTALKDEKKPEGTAKTAKKDVPIPADWIYVYDENKGYGFSVPEGTTGESDISNGFDVMSLTTPSGIDIFVLAYKDKDLTKEGLLEVAVAYLEGLGQKVTPGALKAEGGDYAVADATTVTEDGRKGKLRILVGTDVTDNYMMILGADTDKFAANEKIIDEIWGGFEMWSGGAGNN